MIPRPSKRGFPVPNIEAIPGRRFEVITGLKQELGDSIVVDEVPPDLGVILLIRFFYSRGCGQIISVRCREML